MWIKSIQTAAIEQCEHLTEDDNFYYSQEFFNDLLAFLKTFILWSAVMNKHFQCEKVAVSSAIVESDFNDLKLNRTLNVHC